MSSYDDYRKNGENSLNVFELAKIGDVELLRDVLALDPAVDLNAQDRKGYSPLMYAAYHNHVSMVKWLISRGVDIDNPDISGNTILMGVAFKGHLEVIELLLQAGASVGATNKMGMTALQFAEMFGRKQAAALLNGTRDGFLKRRLHNWFFYVSQKLQNKRSSSYEV